MANGHRRSVANTCQIARASALESGGCLDVLVAKKRLGTEEIIPGKKMLKRIVSMLTRMVLNLSQQVAQQEHEHEHETVTFNLPVPISKRML